MCRDKYVFGLQDSGIRTELLKTHLKLDKTKKSMFDVVTEAKALESAKKANDLIDSTVKGLEEQVHFTSHRDMILRREPGTCHWCGDRRGPHTWRACPAKGKRCNKCNGYDHFARVCLQDGDTKSNNDHRRYSQARRGRGRGQGRGRGSRSVPYQENDDESKNKGLLHHLQTEECDDHPATDNFSVYSLEDRKANRLQEPLRKKRYFAALSMSATGAAFTPMQFQIDTAATCNTISDKSVFTLSPNAKLSRSPFLLYPYGNAKPLRPVGQIELICDRQDRYETLVFQVLPETVMQNKPALLSGHDCERLGLIQIKADEVFSLSSMVKGVQYNQHKPLPGYRTQSISEEPSLGIKPQSPLSCNHLAMIQDNTPDKCRPAASPSKPIIIPSKRTLPPPGKLTKEDILQQYPENFKGIGTLGPPVHFKIREGITPVMMPVHRVPVAKRNKEKEALDDYEKAGILEKVTEPTPWCSNILIRETPNKFRVCIDPSQTVNKAILRPVYQMPTLNEQLHKLCNAKCFSLVDVRDGFLHIPLDEESSFMTTMHTSYGRYRWLRLPFGISSAPEEFTMRLASALEDLEGVLTIADDILVYGEGETQEEAEKDHDRRFIALMERCLQQNITIQQRKLKFKLPQLKFVGNILTQEGMKADPDKVKAITEMPPPNNKSALLRFIGMVNYLSPYCNNLSSAIRPLTMLTKDNVQFTWSKTQDDAFKRAKQLICATPVLRYYDLNKPVVLQVDASEDGLGGAVLQYDENGEPQPVAFTSCSMNQTEQKYSQIEKECLAICNAFAKFDQWLYGKSNIEVHTDHRPLETIFKKALNKAPARLQKMMMRLQRYSFTAKYKSGKSLHLADTLSRAALPSPVNANVTGFEVFRLQLEEVAVQLDGKVSTETEKRILEETMNDDALTTLYSR